MYRVSGVYRVIGFMAVRALKFQGFKGLRVPGPKPGFAE